MRWKRKNSNFIVAAILSLAFTIVTILNIIGPLHTNATGAINKLGPLSFSSIIYWLLSLLILWGMYLFLQKKPEILFFTLMIFGVVVIILEVFLWGWIGS